MTRPKTRYQPGDRIGDRYQVHEVKMGGMGEVYLCLDLEEMLPYALKTFQQRHTHNPKFRAAFENEVLTWVALEKHPNIVRCFFMNIFDNLGLDYQIAVVTTDMFDPNQSGAFQGPVITPANPDAVAEFNRVRAKLPRDRSMP